MSGAEVRRALGRDSGSPRMNRYEAHRQGGHTATNALARMRINEQENWRSRATSDRDEPAPRVSQVAAARLRQQTECLWEQRLETAAARAARTLRQERERERDSGRSR